LREVFYHRFVEMEHRFAKSVERQQFDEQWKGRRLAEIQDLFNRVGEELSRQFLDLSHPNEPPAPLTDVGIDPESLQQLQVLRTELVDKCNQVLGDFERQASEIEPYEVPLSYPQIEIVSRAILWG
jgi:hypothetical protein